MEINKNKLCFNEIKEKDIIFILYKIITNLYICDPNYVKPVFQLIYKKNSDNNLKNYTKNLVVTSWNYYQNFTHVTNNICESYNCILNKLFRVKPKFFKLLYELRIEEHDIVNTYEKRKAGLLGHEIKRNTHVEKKNELFNKIVESIDNLPSKTVDDKKKITEEWFNGLNLFGRNFYY